MNENLDQNKDQLQSTQQQKQNQPQDNIQQNQNPQKSKILWTIIILVILLIIIGGVYYFWKLKTQQTNISEKDEIATLNNSSLKNTDTTIDFREQIQKNRNTIFCSTMQIAWNEFKDIIGENIKLQNQPQIVDYLNAGKLSKNDLSNKDYVAKVGSGKDNIVNIINKELKQKFGDQKQIQDNPGPYDFLAYTYLYKNLEFENEFQETQKPLKFKNKKVKAFYSPDYKTGKQVSIFDYNSDDDFIIKLDTKKTEDELFLAKINPESTLEETYNNTLQRIQKSTPINLNSEDELKIPDINFDINRNYKSLENKLILNEGWKKYDYYIKTVYQWIKFKLDEKGAKLESEAKIRSNIGAMPGGSKYNPKKLIFDKPFLLFMKEQKSQNPYFIVWIANPEILVEY